MDNNYIYRCSQGCRNCPRMRGCFAGDAAAAPAVAANAEASIPERAVPVNLGASIPEQPVPVQPAPAVGAVPAPAVPAEAVPAAPAQTEPLSAETAPAQDAPEDGGVGLPALDTPAGTVPSDGAEAAGSSMDEYLETNCEQGVLRIQAFRGHQAVPVEGVDVTVRCPIGGDETVFFQGRTDASGVIDPILLPAPKPESSLSPGMSNPCSEYEIIAKHPEFETLTTKVLVFPGIKTIQPLQMNLKGV